MLQHNPSEIPLSEGDVNLSTRRNAWQTCHINEETSVELQRDADHFLHQSLSTPCLNVLKSCDGSYIEDLQGRKYLDFHGNNVHQVGFRNPKVLKAVKDQLDTLPFCSRRYTNLPSIELARRLSELSPDGLERVLFAPGGAEAIGIALKIARLKTGRYKTVSLWDSFHGASLEASSIGGEALFRTGLGPLMPGSHHLPPPDPNNCLFGCNGCCCLRCAEHAEYLFEKEGDIAAFIVAYSQHGGLVASYRLLAAHSTIVRPHGCVVDF
jgi:4-aminobutyrate aminotransferase